MEVGSVLTPSNSAAPDSRGYWLSPASLDPEAKHTLRFRLAHNLCVVHNIQVQPLLACLAVSTYTCP